MSFLPQDVPYIFDLQWSINSRLKDVVQQFREVFVAGFWRSYKLFHYLLVVTALGTWYISFFQSAHEFLHSLKDITTIFCAQHLEKLQEIWSILDDIDKSLCVVDPKQPSRSMSNRQINIGKPLVDCVDKAFIFFSLLVFEFTVYVFQETIASLCCL